VSDAIVVGGGVIGLAAAHALARRGARVTLVEARRIGHDLGSSHGPSRIIRLTYQGADYVTLARASFAGWHALAEEAGERLVVPCGGVDFGLPEATFLDEMRAVMAAADVRFEPLDRDGIVARWPQLHPPDGVVGFYQPDYAMLVADRCLAVLADAARRAGAELVEGEAVHAIRARGDGVEVETAAGARRAGRLVLATGSWTAPLAAPLGVELPLTVLREQLAFYRAPDEAAYAPGRFPLLIHRFPRTTMLGSGFPLLGRPHGVKVMLDRIGPAVDPSDPDRSLHAAHLARLDAYVRELLPGLGERIAAVSCRYTMTPDEDFVLDRLPGAPQVVLAAACSGHGFKFAPVLGEALADLALDGTSAVPIGRFRLDRPALARRWSA
jgi:monomeric sarcosine oxidase